MEEKKDSESSEKRRTMRLALRDGSAFNVMEHFGTAYFEAFLVALGFVASQLSAILTVPHFLNSLLQLLSQKLIRRFGRFNVMAYGIFFQSMSIVLFVFLGMLIYQELLPMNPLLIIISLSFFYATGTIAGHAWISIMGDIVPENRRGRYFSARAKIMAFTALVSLIAAGLIVDWLDSIYGVYGFIAIFAIAVIARLYSFMLLRQFYDPSYEPMSRTEEFSFFRFIAQTRRSNFARYSWFMGAFIFSVFIVAPILSYYQLRILEFSYFQFTMLKVFFLIGSILSLSFWGKVTDTYGNRVVFFGTGILASTLAMGWAFITDFWMLLALEIYAGIVWSGFNLATSNYIFDAVTPKKRAIVSSYIALMRGTAILLSGQVALLLLNAEGFLESDIAMSLFGTKYQVIFFVSGLLRLTTVLLFLKLVREVRTVQNKDFFGIILSETYDYRLNTGYIISTVTKPVRYVFSRFEQIEERSLEKVLKDDDDENKEKRKG
ncbi:MAG: MFS transporter [Candidatus Woesearchaeota archaeon]